jgi:hypothetical protein
VRVCELEQGSGNALVLATFPPSIIQTGTQTIKRSYPFTAALCDLTTKLLKTPSENALFLYIPGLFQPVDSTSLLNLVVSTSDLVNNYTNIIIGPFSLTYSDSEGEVNPKDGGAIKDVFGGFTPENTSEDSIESKLDVIVTG